MNKRIDWLQCWFCLGIRNRKNDTANVQYFLMLLLLLCVDVLPSIYHCFGQMKNVATLKRQLLTLKLNCCQKTNCGCLNVFVQTHGDPFDSVCIRTKMCTVYLSVCNRQFDLSCSSIIPTKYGLFKQMLSHRDSSHSRQSFDFFFLDPIS